MLGQHEQLPDDLRQFAVTGLVEGERDFAVSGFLSRLDVLVVERPLNIDFLDDINPDSLTVIKNAKLEPSLMDLAPGTPIQFERTGYFVLDKDSKDGAPVFNKTMGLRDTWAKQQKKG